MFSFIRGKILQKTATSVEIETNGLGFEIMLSLNSLTKIGNVGDEVFLYTVVLLRDEKYQIYGFVTVSEKDIFKELINIPGIGPKIALGILSNFEVDEFIDCVQKNDVDNLTKLPGIGRKTAERILLEFREKANKIQFKENGLVEQKNASLFTEAISALNVLGYPENRVRMIVRDLLNNMSKKDLTVENLIKQALKILNR